MAEEDFALRRTTRRASATTTKIRTTPMAAYVMLPFPADDAEEAVEVEEAVVTLDVAEVIADTGWTVQRASYQSWGCISACLSKMPV